MNFFLLITTMLVAPCFGLKQDFKAFRDFVSFNYKPSEIIRRNCSWQYAIIKVRVDKDNTITDYHIENDVSDELKTSFNFLKGYKFNKKYISNKHTIIFFISLENQRVDKCDTPPYNSHVSAEKIFRNYKLSHQKASDSNYYISDIITTVVYDPVN